MSVRFRQVLPAEESEERKSAKERIRETATDIVGALVGAWSSSKTGKKGCGVCQKEAQKLRKA